MIKIDSDNVTIKGNGHIIDAGGASQYFSIFKVNGNNVKIENITFANSQPKGTMQIEDSYLYQHVTSPVSWNGNGGCLSNCDFHNCAAVNSEALSWMGNNGKIENCLFKDNIARGVGGAIYIGGTNNIINNSCFINSASLLTGEAIYVDRNRKNIKCENLAIEEDAILLIDGNNINIDVNNLYYSYFTSVGILNMGGILDMAPIMYKTLTLGIAGDEYHTYYYEYDNKTGQFAFKVHTDIRGGKREGIELIQTYIFNITSYNDIYKSLFNHNYSTSVTQIADVLVTSVDDYRGIFTKEKAIPSMLNINCENQTKALNVVFSKPILVESTFCWNLKELGYNVININGNGSTIHAETKPREEFKWAITAEGDYTLTASNIKVEGFNTAIVNNGICILNNVTLHNNKMDYICERDDGAAMLNSGFVIANDCTFTDNYAKNGGAIFSQGQLILNNCTYNDNTGYGTGNDILNVDKGSVFINGKEIKGSQGTVTYVESISDTATALISAVVGVGTVLLGVASGAIAFVLSGGNVVVAVAVGVAAGAAIGGIVGTAAARAITSGQYNLAYDRVSTLIILYNANEAI